MPRYFFHFRGAVNAADEVGEELADDDSAYQYGRRIAWELARNAPPAQNRGSAIVVTGHAGAALFTISLEGSTDPSL